MLRLQNFGFDAAAGLPPTCHGFAPRLAPLRRPWGRDHAHHGGAALYKASKRYLTATVTGLVVAILLSLTAILVRGIAAPEMDGKISADSRGLRRSPP
jgi:hypothetical protein